MSRKDRAERPCDVCGAGFVPRGVQSRYCGPGCARTEKSRRARAARLPQPKRPCDVCGVGFIPLRADGRYCGPRCAGAADSRRVRASRARRLERLCDVCGAAFMPHSTQGRYCSPDCARTAAARRQRGKYVPRSERDRDRHRDWLSRHRDRVAASLRDTQRRKVVVLRAKEYPPFARDGFLLVRTRPGAAGVFFRACPKDAPLLPAEQPVAVYEPPAEQTPCNGRGGRGGARWAVWAPSCAPSHVRAIAAALARVEEERGRKGGRAKTRSQATGR